MSETLSIRERVLSENDREAERLRRTFRAAGTLAANLISSPGSGKTALLEATVRAIAGRWSIAAIEGDIATERDADRLRALGIPARQILTGGACHLDARMVGKAVDEAAFPRVDFLFIENVGNLVCPTAFDLGEDLKIAALSVAEGDDKPFKYPALFARAALTVITKSDLLPFVDFDLEAVRHEVRTLNPGGSFLVTSARGGEGIDEWCQYLQGQLASKRVSGS